MKSESALLLDLARAARQILAFVEGATQDAFVQDGRLQSAVLYQLAVVGEVAGRLSEAFRTEHPGVDWRGIRGLRNHILHVYDHVDLNIVWAVATRSVPELLRYVEPLLPPEPPATGR